MTQVGKGAGPDAADVDAEAGVTQWHGSVDGFFAK
jgi:hypothetical protein